ncbi:hypothetical protein EEB14_51250 [Rhodococcus sp. WS4]|nr:hypothetical protein EEB14_51250 [Rhodococcus sp. WS4]
MDPSNLYGRCAALREVYGHEFDRVANSGPPFGQPADDGGASAAGRLPHNRRMPVEINEPGIPPSPRSHRPLSPPGLGAVAPGFSRRVSSMPRTRLGAGALAAVHHPPSARALSGGYPSRAAGQVSAPRPPGWRRSSSIVCSSARLLVCSSARLLGGAQRAGLGAQVGEFAAFPRGGLRAAAACVSARVWAS